jgi:predicted lipoprotein with Yx(FWY)xxD motif
VRILGRKEVRPRVLVGWIVGVVVVTLFVLPSLGVFSTAKKPHATVVSAINTSRYGSVLVVGGSKSGGLYRFPLYEFSGDVGDHFGCETNKIVAYDLGANESVPLTCTGPERDLLADASSDDWPALTTDAAPIAGPGVNPKLLGSTFRRGVGTQVTYAGHPLYLYDPSSQPFLPQGENVMETVKPLPPWRGFWYLVSTRTGALSPGVATLQVETLPNGQHALAAEEDPNVDPIEVTLYSGAVANGDSKCQGHCASDWTPLLTSARPRVGPGVNGALVGVIRRADGNFEVTFDHRPLYLYDQERIRLNPKEHLVATGSVGNGAGERGPGGMMSIVTLPK